MKIKSFRTLKGFLYFYFSKWLLSACWLYVWLYSYCSDRLRTTVALWLRRQYLTMTHASPKWTSISEFKSKTDPTKRTECFSRTILPNRALPSTPTSGMTSSKNLPHLPRRPRWDTGAIRATSPTCQPGIQRQTSQACSDAPKVRTQGSFRLKCGCKLLFYNHVTPLICSWVKFQ